MQGALQRLLLLSATPIVTRSTLHEASTTIREKCSPPNSTVTIALSLTAGKLAASSFSPANDECKSRLVVNGRPAGGFLLVANNAELNNWTKPTWLGDDWIVVRFNDCADDADVVQWPHAPHPGREVIFARQSDINNLYWGSICGPAGTYCDEPQLTSGECSGSCLARECNMGLERNFAGSDVFYVEGDECDVPGVNMPDLHVFGDEHASLSTGATVALWLLQFSAPIVLAGFDQHQAQAAKGVRWEGHAWDFETELMQNLSSLELVHGLHDEASMLAFSVAIPRSEGIAFSWYPKSPKMRGLFQRGPRIIRAEQAGQRQHASRGASVLLP